MPRTSAGCGAPNAPTLSATIGTDERTVAGERDVVGHPRRGPGVTTDVAGRIRRTGSTAAAASSANEIVHLRVLRARVGEHDALLPAGTRDPDREPPRGRELAAERQPESPASVAAVEVLRLLGDDPAPPHGDLRGDGVDALDRLVDRDRHAREARDHDALEPAGRAPAGVGDRLDVDDGVVRERVEEREPELGALRRGAGREARLGRGLARARAHGACRRRGSACARPRRGPRSSRPRRPGPRSARGPPRAPAPPGPGATVYGRATGGTSEPPSTVTTACSGRRSTLPIASSSSARPPGFAVPSAQYHVVATPTASSRGPLAGGGRRPGSTRSVTIAATTSTTTTTTAARSGSGCSRHHLGVGGRDRRPSTRRGRAADRRRPRRRIRRASSPAITSSSASSGQRHH